MTMAAKIQVSTLFIGAWFRRLVSIGSHLAMAYTVVTLGRRGT